MLKLLVATKNKGKIKELEQLLKDLPLKLLSLDDFSNIDEVEETGKTFTENAKIKASSYALQTNCWALADDSGLEVEALKNAPGVYSARYAGINASDWENNAKVLSALNKVNSENKKAKFVCVMAISNEKGEIQFTAKGICTGKIASKPLGTNGFGYDSIFIPDDYTNTFGQLSNVIKQKISHRSRAIKKIIRFFNKNVSS